MIIFDFDQTLVDTQPVEHLRRAKKWREVMLAAPNLRVYDGIGSLLARMHERGQPLAIVTKSPDMVPKAFIKLHKWPIDIVVGYHDVSARKPDPEGLLLAMSKAKAKANETFHIGDQPEDTQASRSAGVIAIGSAWGIDDPAPLVASRPDHLFHEIPALEKFLIQKA